MFNEGGTSRALPGGGFGSVGDYVSGAISLGNTIASGVQNRKQRAWNEKMYNLQRSHALADWQRNNEYNSPAAQMQRLKEAGLNPNLMYGKGTTGTSSSTPNQAKVLPYNPKDLNIGKGLDFYDLKAKGAQTSILSEQARQAKIDTQIRLADAYKRGVSMDKNGNVIALGEDYDLTKLMRDNEGKLLDNSLKDQQYKFNELNNAATLKQKEAILEKTISEDKVLQARLEGIKADNLVKDLNSSLAQMGIRPNDPLWAYAVTSVMDGISTGDITLEDGIQAALLVALGRFTSGLKSLKGKAKPKPKKSAKPKTGKNEAAVKNPKTGKYEVWKVDKNGKWSIKEQ